MTTRLTLSIAASLAIVGGTAMLAASRSAPRDGAAVLARPVAGATATTMSDGRTLVVGGEGRSAETRIRRGDGLEIPVPARLDIPRAWHSASVLPDGRVVVWGGIDDDGRFVSTPELLDVDTSRWTALGTMGSPRALHSTTVLTDGRVLIAGGIDGDGAEPAMEIWDPRAGAVLALGRGVGRYGHEATLVADGRVLLSGGVTSSGLPAGDAVVVDAESGTVEPAPPDRPSAPELSGSVPEDGATDVDASVTIGLRFSSPIDATMLNGAITLADERGTVASRTVVAEDGRLVFVTPLEPLAPGVRHRVVFDGARAHVPSALISFTTRARRTRDPEPDDAPERSKADDQPRAPHHVPEGDVWVPDADALRGRWRSDFPESPWRTLPALTAAPGVTALAAQVLRLDGWPLEGVQLRLGERHATTDATGRFLLTDVRAGRQTLVVDARPAGTKKTAYGFFMIVVDVVADVTTALPYTVWMPVIDTAHAVRLPIPTTRETVVTTPLIPGLALHVPANTRLRKPDGTLATEISITPIPVDRPPFPLPERAAISVYFTLQPGGAVAERGDGRPHPGLALDFPNTTAIDAGSMIPYWAYDAAGRGWFKYGVGRVTGEGDRVLPDPGVTIDRLTCGSIGGDGGGGGCRNCCSNAGDPVACETGIFVQQESDLFLPDVIPIDLRRTYRSTDLWARNFGLGTTHPYDMRLVATNLALNGCGELQVIAPDTGEAITFEQSGGGTSCTSPNPMLPQRSQPGRFFDATLTFRTDRDPTNAEGYHGFSGWDLRLKDGTIYELTTFAASERTALTAIQDRYGNRLRIARENLSQSSVGRGGARVGRITSPNGRWVAFTYLEAPFAQGHVKQTRDSTGRTVDYTYDDATGASARLTTVTRPDPNGGRTPLVATYSYDGTSNRMAAVRSARLNAECPAPCAQPPTLAIDYWPDGSVKKETLADGVSAWQFAYNFPSPGFPSAASTLTTVTDPRGTITRYVFDTEGFPLSQTRAFGVEPEQQTTIMAWQVDTHFLSSFTDALNRRTDYVHDQSGNVITLTRLAGTPNAAATTFAYDGPFGQVTRITDPLGHVTQLAYRADGALQTLTDARNKSWTFGADAAGRTTSVTDPLRNTTRYTYTGADLTAITDAAGHTTTRVVDVAGRVRKKTDPLGHSTWFDYDALDRLVQVQDPIGGRTQLTYDAGCNLRSVTDALDHTTTYEHDAVDRLVRRIDPLSRAETFAYDALGNIVTWTDRKGAVTERRYDALGRSVFTGFKKVGTSYESMLTSTWDDGDRLRTIADTSAGAGTITRDYDDLDHVAQETSGDGTVQYTYDVAGRRQTMRIVGTPNVDYAYGFDEADRLTSVAQGATAAALTYDDGGHRQSVTLPNGIVVRYGYDAVGHVTSIVAMKGGTTVLDLSYGYDAAGNRTGLDGDSKRTGAPSTLTSATYDAANQIRTWEGATYTYDANGNLVGDGTRAYVWNARNELTSINGPGVTASFAYDPVGRRIGRTVNGSSTRFLYDASNRLKATQGTSASLMLDALALDEHFARIDGNAVTSFLTDALGSAWTLADAAGQATAQYLYEPYGAAMKLSGTATTDQLFTGREDDGTGLYYYRARYYSPSTGRFVRPDPLGFKGSGVNLYGYVGDSPLNAVDPLGLAVWLCTRDAFWGLIGNHAFFWDDTTNTTCGRGKGGYNSQDRPEAPGSVCRPIPGSSGREAGLMDCCKHRGGDGAYVPGTHDCHTSLENCMKEAGLPSPGAPGGRLGPRCQRSGDMGCDKN